MAPATPSEVPTSSTVTGSMTISRMMKGTERSTLTTKDSKAFSTGLAASRPLPDRYRIMAFTRKLLKPNI